MIQGDLAYFRPFRQRKTAKLIRTMGLLLPLIPCAPAMDEHLNKLRQQVRNRSKPHVANYLVFSSRTDIAVRRSSMVVKLHARQPVSTHVNTGCSNGDCCTKVIFAKLPTGYRNVTAVRPRT